MKGFGKKVSGAFKHAVTVVEHAPEAAQREAERLAEQAEQARRETQRAVEAVRRAAEEAARRTAAEAKRVEEQALKAAAQAEQARREAQRAVEATRRAAEEAARRTAAEAKHAEEQALKAAGHIKDDIKHGGEALQKEISKVLHVKMPKISGINIGNQIDVHGILNVGKELARNLNNASSIFTEARLSDLAKNCQNLCLPDMQIINATKTCLEQIGRGATVLGKELEKAGKQIEASIGNLSDEQKAILVVATFVAIGIAVYASGGTIAFAITVEGGQPFTLLTFSKATGVVVTASAGVIGAALAGNGEPKPHMEMSLSVEGGTSHSEPDKKDEKSSGLPQNGNSAQPAKPASPGNASPPKGHSGSGGDKDSEAPQNTYDLLISTLKQIPTALCIATRFPQACTISALINVAETLQLVLESDTIGDKQKTATDLLLAVAEKVLDKYIDKKFFEDAALAIGLLKDRVKFIVDELKKALEKENTPPASTPAAISAGLIGASAPAMASSVAPAVAAHLVSSIAAPTPSLGLVTTNSGLYERTTIDSKCDARLFAAGSPYCYWVDGNVLNYGLVESGRLSSRGVLCSTFSDAQIAVIGNSLFWQEPSPSTKLRRAIVADGKLTSLTVVDTNSNIRLMTADGNYLYWQNHGSSMIHRRRVADGKVGDVEVITRTADKSLVCMAAHKGLFYWRDKNHLLCGLPDAKSESIRGVTTVDESCNAVLLAADSAVIYWRDNNSSFLNRAFVQISALPEKLGGASVATANATSSTASSSSVAALRASLPAFLSASSAASSTATAGSTASAAIPPVPTPAPAPAVSAAPGLRAS